MIGVSRIDPLRVRRQGVSLVEILIAVGILAVASVPVLTVASRGIDQLRHDRLRLEAEGLCHDTLERFGRYNELIVLGLNPTPNPNVSQIVDPWTRWPDSYTSLGRATMADLSARHDLHLTLLWKKDLIPGLSLVRCEVTWAPDGPGSSRRERIGYGRFSILP